MLMLPVIYAFICYFYLVSTEKRAEKFSINKFKNGIISIFQGFSSQVRRYTKKVKPATGNSSTTGRSKRETVGAWGYGPQSGPKTWGGICQTGRRQSPINIELGSVIVKDFPSFYFGEHYLNNHKFYAKNNGHTIYVALEDNLIRPVIYGGGLSHKFIFVQLHLHWESEHEFEGKRADLEMHLVHYNAKYESFAEASAEPDGLAVLGVIFNRSNETDSLTDSFFDYILEASTLGGHSSHISAPGNSILSNENHEEKWGIFALRDLLPKYVSRFYRYEGSLTTPDCRENVKWTVFINRLSVSNRVLEALRTLRDHDGNTLTQNFRAPKSLNGREVYIQIKNYEKPLTELEQMTRSGCSTNTLFPFMSYIVLHSYFLL